MPSKQGMKKGGPPLQTPLLRFTTRSALAFDLTCNLHKIRSDARVGWRNWIPWCRTCTSPIRADVPGRDILDEMATAPTSRRIAMNLALLLGMPCTSTAQTPCAEVPVGFRQDIRLPDVWESAWESVWPNALEAMAFWRAENFIEVQQLASGVPVRGRLADLPEGPQPPAECTMAACAGVRHACVRRVPCGCPQVPDDFWPTLCVPPTHPRRPWRWR